MKTFKRRFVVQYFGDGASLAAGSGITGTFIISPSNDVLFHMHQSVPVRKGAEPDLSEHVSGGIVQLIERARRRIDGNYETVGGFVKEDGELNLATAKVIQPYDQAKWRKSASPAQDTYVAVFLRPIDDAFLSAIEKNFNLKHLTYSAPDTDIETSIPLVAVNGDNFGALSWQIRRPSHGLILVALPAFIALVSCAGLLGWYVLAKMRRSQEALMQAMQDAKSADRSKNEFLANMSHELRTPLNAMIGFSEIMKEEVLGPAGSERYRSYANDIFESGHHLLAMIEDILDIAKIESGNFDLNKTPVSLFDCAVSTIRLVSGRLDGRDVKLLNKVPTQLPKLNADLRALRQIMINLLSNAIKFTDAGTIEISAWLGEDGGLCVSVRDTGMGIAEADYERVMQPFVQIAQSSTRNHSGSGLGLALVKSLVAQHDGTVEITSAVGIGTTVTCGFSPTQTVMQDIQADRPSTVASAEGIVQERGGMDAVTSSGASH